MLDEFALGRECIQYLKEQARPEPGVKLLSEYLTAFTAIWSLNATKLEEMLYISLCSLSEV